MSRYLLTDAQRRDWTHRLQARFAMSDLELARRMDLDTAIDRGGKDYNKTVAGYVGDFRRGDKRGLTYFFESQPRLAALAGAIGCNHDDLRSHMKTVLRLDRVDEDLLWLSGFEDLGPVSFDDGFVFPPLFSSDARIDAEGLSRMARTSPSGIIAISGAPGSGVTTILQWLLRRAAEDGWRAARWDGQLPRGRAIALLADPDDGLETLEREDELARGAAPGTSDVPGRHAVGLATWVKSGGHRVIRAQRGGLSLAPVDILWLRAFVERVSVQAGKRLNVTKLNDGVLHEIAQLRVGPEEAGIRLRERLEGRNRPPVRALEEAARRRLRAKHHEEGGLSAFETWFPELALAALRDRAVDPVALVDGSAVAAARRQLEEQLPGLANAELLRTCLPALTGEGSLRALRGANLVSEAGGVTTVRLIGMVAVDIADRVRDDPSVLRRCVIAGDTLLLRAVAGTIGGPAALVSALEQLDAPSLKAAFERNEADWIRTLPMTDRLVARLVATAELTGEGHRVRRVLKRLEQHWPRSGSTFTDDATTDAMLSQRLADARSGIGTLLSNAPLPSLELLASCWHDAARELGLSSTALKPEQVRLARALHLARREDLVDAEVWNLVPPDLGYPASWFELAQSDVNVARIALDPSTRVIPPDASAYKLHGPRDILNGATVAHEMVPWLARRALEHLRAKVSQEDGDRWKHVRTLLQPIAPVVAGRDRVMAALLRQVAEEWIAAANAEHLPRTAEAMRTTIAGLLPVLRAVSERDRVACLRTPEGRIGPLWREALEAGVPTPAIRSLWTDTAAGRVVWPVPVWGTHKGDGLAQARAELTPFVLRNLEPPELIELEVLTPSPADLNEETFQMIAGIPNMRRWIWSGITTLDDSGSFWRLLEEPRYSSARMATAHANRNGRVLGGVMAMVLQAVFASVVAEETKDGDCSRADREGIQQALVLPMSTLTLPRWELLVRAAILASVPVEALWHTVNEPLLHDIPARNANERPSAWGPRKTVAELVTLLQRHDRPRIRPWLIASAAALDHREFIHIWRDADLSQAELNRLLAARTGDRVGDGLVPALLHLAPEQLSDRLADPRTREATLHAAANDPDLRPQLPSAIASAGSAPAMDTLKLLLRNADLEAFALLDDACAAWPIEQQRTLWTRVAACAEEADRRRAWRRLTTLSECS